MPVCKYYLTHQDIWVKCSSTDSTWCKVCRFWYVLYEKKKKSMDGKYDIPDTIHTWIFLHAAYQRRSK